MASGGGSEGEAGIIVAGHKECPHWLFPSKGPEVLTVPVVLKHPEFPDRHRCWWGFVEHFWCKRQNLEFVLEVNICFKVNTDHFCHKTVVSSWLLSWQTAITCRDDSPLYPTLLPKWRQMLWVELCPPNSICWSSNINTQNVTLFGNKVITDIIG